MATFIPAAGVLRNVFPENDRYFTLVELQRYVDGNIEIVSCHSFLLVLNEHGKLRGCPFNPIATHITRGLLAADDVIVGDVLLCLPEELEDEEGDEEMTRAEHIAWCKARAIAYVDQSQLRLAFASMVSDLSKHEDTIGHPGIGLGARLMFEGQLNTPDAMRRFIEDFT